MANKNTTKKKPIIKRTPKGNITAESRKKTATLSDDRFPIGDKKSAESAIKLRGHRTTTSERKKIVNKAAKYAPIEAKKARETDKMKRKASAPKKKTTNK